MKELELLEKHYSTRDLDDNFIEVFSSLYIEGDELTKGLLLKHFLLKWHDVDTMCWIGDIIEV